MMMNPDRWFGFAKEHGLDPFGRDSLANEKLHRSVLSRVQRQLHEFPGYAKVRRVILTLDPWTVEDGLLTPTLKLKRAVVAEQFAKDVDLIYK